MRGVQLGIIGVLTALSLVGCSKKEARFQGRAELKTYEKPARATYRIEGQKFPYCLWYDPQKWIIWDTPFDTGKEVAEWNLALIDPQERKSIGKDTKISAGVSTYIFTGNEITEQEFKTTIRKNLIEAHNLDSFVDISSDERLVNGIQVYTWNFKFQPVGEQAVTAFIYFYPGRTGAVAVTAYTPTEQWDKNKKTILDLLNGFCLLRS